MCTKRHCLRGAPPYEASNYPGECDGYPACFLCFLCVAVNFKLHSDAVPNDDDRAVAINSAGWVHIIMLVKVKVIEILVPRIACTGKDIGRDDVLFVTLYDCES